MSSRTEAAFAALVGLDPLRSALVPGVESESESESEETCIARIIATPRSGATVTTSVTTLAPPTRWAPQRTASPRRRRSRYGAIGIVASAAMAVIATVLWASPSAGSPPDQAATMPVVVGQMHPSARP